MKFNLHGEEVRNIKKFLMVWAALLAMVGSTFAQLSAPANVDTNVTAIVSSTYDSLTSGDGASVITWVLVVAGGLLALGIIIGLVKRAISSIRGSA